MNYEDGFEENKLLIPGTCIIPLHMVLEYCSEGDLVCSKQLYVACRSPILWLQLFFAGGMEHIKDEDEGVG